MKKIYYLCYFDIPEHADQQRNFVLSAATKSTYIAKAFGKAGYAVEIVSASGTCGGSICPGSVTELGENLTLRLFDAKPAKTTVHRVFARRFLKNQLKKYLLENVTENDVLLVYHSLAYMDLVREIKQKKNPKLILETNEVYADVTGNEKIRPKEMAFLQSADGYVLSTELLLEKVNPQNKPFTVNYGIFAPEKKQFAPLFHDGKIHCVYAGVLEPRKGAGTAIAAAKFLPENYHIHIIGFGSEQDTAEIQRQIAEISEQTACTVTFDGKKSGDEYLQFLQSCQVGFATQSSAAAFNATSFPSKVLSYLSNGLRVVSVRIQAIETSKVADLMYFYDGDSPKAVAEAIQSIDFSDGYDSRKRLSDLDASFIADCEKLTAREGVNT
ncbi:MAG: glycosyltransferase [Candidatus Fimenecus sp.]